MSHVSYLEKDTADVRFLVCLSVVWLVSHNVYDTTQQSVTFHLVPQFS